LILKAVRRHFDLFHRAEKYRLKIISDAHTYQLYYVQFSEFHTGGINVNNDGRRPIFPRQNFHQQFPSNSLVLTRSILAAAQIAVSSLSELVINARLKQIQVFIRLFAGVIIFLFIKIAENRIRRVVEFFK
jgi:hypothetical protein